MQKEASSVTIDGICCLATIHFKVTENVTTGTREHSLAKTNSWLLLWEVELNLEFLEIAARVDHFRVRNI